MNIRQVIFRMWFVLSGVWLLGTGFVWYQNFSAERTQITALDECGKFYPPMPEGYVLDLYCKSIPCSCSFPPCIPKADSGAQARAEAKMTLLEKFDVTGRWRTWEVDQAKLHPQCAPKIGATSFVDFIGMHTSDREVLRRQFEDGLRASRNTALVYGSVVPTGLLMIGLVLVWVLRGFRSW